MVNVHILSVENKMYTLILRMVTYRVIKFRYPKDTPTIVAAENGLDFISRPDDLRNKHIITSKAAKAEIDRRDT